MKHAKLWRKNETMIDFEYEDVSAIVWELENCQFVTIDKKTIPVDTIDCIEWID